MCTQNQKTFFFMAGLPRSGSTLLSAILGQNPNIYTGPHSDMANILHNMSIEFLKWQAYQTGFMPKGYENVLKQTIHNFYFGVNKPYVIDKNRAWGDPINLELLNVITDNIKIICPVRPILEILASFLNLANSKPDNILNDSLENNSSFSYRSLDDTKCESFYKKVEISILSLSSSLKPEHKNKFHFVHYDDLVTDPKKTINLIYEYLDIPKYNHSFDNIKWNSPPKEDSFFRLPNLHKVNPTIKKSDTDISILSDFIRNKYANALDFLGDKKL